MKTSVGGRTVPSYGSVGLVLLALSCCASFALAADSALRIGVFDQQSVGGQGASIEGLIRGLRKQGYNAEAITDLQMLTLLPCDIIYLSDTHTPGRVRDDWEKTLKDFVGAGGSLLQTWHHHIFSEVGVGIQRVYRSRRMHVQPGHPAVAGVSDFDASFGDHIIEQVGVNGTVLLKNDAGQPVAVAGSLGMGKVISTGLALAIPDGGRSVEPSGSELALLTAFLKWLAPEAPRGQRMERVLRTPRLEIAPPEAITVAGFQASFEVKVGLPTGGTVKLECAGAEVTRKATLRLTQDSPAMIEVFSLLARTESGEDVQREGVVRAVVGDKSLEGKFKVTAVYVYGRPPANERRGVWLHVGADRAPKEVMPELRKLGINMVVLRIAGGTAAWYASKVQPDLLDPLAPDGDWLAEAVKYAHQNGIEIHPYVNNCLVEGRTSAATLKQLREEGRLQEGPDGRPFGWFCPSQEVNVEAIEKVMLELATQYPVDGVQYDFIRYRDSFGCVCAKCRALFEKETGKPVANWPGDVVDGERKTEWTEFRCRRISAIVQRVSTRIRKEAPKVRISAAVFSNWPQCREQVGQDWVRWCKEGWLDFVCPMTYTLDARQFAELAAAHRIAVPQGFPILEGVGIMSLAGAMKQPDALAIQIALARKNGASGFIGFCYTPKHTISLFGPLKDWLKEEE
ncbi:MAG: family 10 glycosylhydrolase [Armatimonadetes bacterium]|nr:family 10 glycosylhydrolase [Armatimonadota bacterium]PIU64150.1 MAG: hypothetical protein COS85_13635 [Armatimonadetes bacterium CG07_land_8_20_14_0_80_59_28]PIX39733.1 MAG: hypothetical protein COZ56_16610 [Armatimonadetes bacterium CG_4_8_14_3_um_filter_58_9]PIY48648.1 MAG: hypothetical protein COZ05_02615 [Armatimonadetes bacterium CG_4_10_14_3_um_filter_59_10]